MIRQRFQFLGKCHNKNLPILHKGIFGCEAVRKSQDSELL